MLAQHTLAPLSCPSNPAQRRESFSSFYFLLEIFSVFSKYARVVSIMAGLLAFTNCLHLRDSIPAESRNCIDQNFLPLGKVGMERGPEGLCPHSLQGSLKRGPGGHGPVRLIMAPGHGLSLLWEGHCHPHQSTCDDFDVPPRRGGHQPLQAVSNSASGARGHAA